MQRYFVNEKSNNNFILSKDDSYHIKKVMRMNKGDLIEIIFDKKLYICKINNINDIVDCSIIEEKSDYNELEKNIIICQSLVVEQKMDLILQKGTELGMSSLIPLSVKNCVVKENNKSDKKIDRWQKICKEASEQSKRNIIPKVYNIMNIKDLINIQADLKILLTVNENKKSFKSTIQNLENCDTIIIVVGPEGGFDNKEEEVLINNGFISTTLGDRVLRTETASLVALSYINYELMR